MGSVDQRVEWHPSKIDKDGRRHYTIRAIPYQDPQREAEPHLYRQRLRPSVSMAPPVPLHVVE